MFIVFQSGKCVITGGKNRAQIVAVWNKFFTEILLTYRTGANHGNSGNYRMCQLSQKKHRDLDQLRAIAHIRTDIDKVDLLLDAHHIPSQAWQGHVWNVSDRHQMELLQLLEPELYAKHLLSHLDLKLNDLISSERQAQLSILETVADPEVQQVLELACSNTSAYTKEVEAELKQNALYAYPQRPTSVTTQERLHKRQKSEK